jgi:hypothetical protein
MGKGRGSRGRATGCWCTIQLVGDCEIRCVHMWLWRIMHSPAPRWLSRDRLSSTRTPTAPETPWSRPVCLDSDSTYFDYRFFVNLCCIISSCCFGVRLVRLAGVVV